MEATRGRSREQSGDGDDGGGGAVATERVRRGPDGTSRWVGGSLGLESGPLQRTTPSLLLRATGAPHPQ